MLKKLHLIDYHSHHQVEQFPSDKSFVLKTCQRSLFVGFEKPQVLTNSQEDIYLEGLEAYHYMLEIICGIKSKFTAESEIVGQFKEAYYLYLKAEYRDPSMIRVLEKLFKDAKEIRTHYLKGIGQKTYASIVRKLVYQNSLPRRVLILGTGSLSEDIVNQLKKRVEQIFISGRSIDKVQTLCQKHSTYSLSWKDFDLYRHFDVIVNTIGVRELTLFRHTFFDHWREIHSENCLFIDLGSPSIIDTRFSHEHGVLRLEDVFGQSIIKEKEKLEKVETAKEAIKLVAQKRLKAFQSSLQKGASLA